jgi:hypothetical protein
VEKLALSDWIRKTRHRRRMGDGTRREGSANLFRDRRVVALGILSDL